MDTETPIQPHTNGRVETELPRVPEAARGRLMALSVAAGAARAVATAAQAEADKIADRWNSEFATVLATLGVPQGDWVINFQTGELTRRDAPAPGPPSPN